MSKETTTKLAQSDPMDNLRQLVKRNLTEAQRETLVKMGTIDSETGLFKADPVNLQSAESTPLPMGTQKAVPLKGRVMARVGYEVHDIRLWKNKGGQVYATSNTVTKYTKDGEEKTFTQYHPNFPPELSECREAWQAFMGLLPKYAEAAGWL